MDATVVSSPWSSTAKAPIVVDRCSMEGKQCCKMLPARVVLIEPQIFLVLSFFVVRYRLLPGFSETESPSSFPGMISKDGFETSSSKNIFYYDTKSQVPRK